MNRNNETGEFELVVGNRQLLSGFFIVVLLFAVAFAMGYVVGQNSPRSAKLQTDNTANTAATGEPDNRPQPTSTPAPATQSPATVPSDQATAQTPADATPRPTTQPATEQPGTAQTAAPPAAPPAAPEAPPPGSYWQVMAVNQTDAEVVVRTLKDKGFPALMAPGPNNLMRVLVGPYNDTPTMSKAKTELENAGFHPIKK
jgi:cell division septation protein DedD